MKFIAALATICLFMSIQSWGHTRADEKDLLIHCENITPWKPFAICLVRTKNSNNKDVIFHLHGAGGNSEHWLTKYRGTRDAWRAQGFEPPAVATVNFGPIWFLAEKNDSMYSGLFHYYIETVMPWIEQKLGYVPRRRLLLGESVGGLNAIQYMFKKPKFFEKVALICPAITVVGPHSTKEEVEEFKKRTGAEDKKIKWLLRGERSFFPSAQSWESANPFTLVDKYKEHLPELLISCGSEDSYGFFEGTELIALQLRDQNPGRVSWYPVPGDHCARPHSKLAEFFK